MIKQEVAPRSFEVQVSNGNILRRNRQQIRKLQSTTSSIQYTSNDPHEDPEIFTDYDDSDSDTSTLPYNDAEAEMALRNEDEPYHEKELETLYDDEPKQHDRALTISSRGRLLKPRRPADYEEL